MANFDKSTYTPEQFQTCVRQAFVELCDKLDIVDFQIKRPYDAKVRFFSELEETSALDMTFDQVSRKCDICFDQNTPSVEGAPMVFLKRLEELVAAL